MLGLASCGILYTMETKTEVRISPRMRQVLELKDEGLTNAQIAGRLNLSVYRINYITQRLRLLGFDIKKCYKSNQNGKH